MRAKWLEEHWHPIPDVDGTQRRRKIQQKVSVFIFTQIIFLISSCQKLMHIAFVWMSLWVTTDWTTSLSSSARAS